MTYNGASEDFANLTEIRIGWFGPSDAADPLHGDFWWAANLAVEEANQHPSTADRAVFTTLPIRLVSRWAPDPWRAGVSLLARMVFDEQPLALLGSVDSASTHLAEQVVAKANLPLVSPVATDKTATLAGVSWMFSCAPDDTAIARVLVEDLLVVTAASLEQGAGSREQESVAGIQKLGNPSGITRQRPEVAREAAATMSGAQVGNQKLEFPNRKFPVVLLATTDHESRMTAREVMHELSRHGLLPEYRFDLPPGTADATEPLHTIAGAHIAAVIVIANAPDSARLTRAVRAQLGAVPVLGGSAMGRARFLELAGPAAEGVRFPLLFAAGAQDEVAAQFMARFTAERHHAPDYTAALAYDATRLLIEAIRRAGPNRARIREAIVQLSPWSGIAGPIAFDGTGQNVRPQLALGTIRDGVVAPFSASNLKATPPPVFTTDEPGAACPRIQRGRPNRSRFRNRSRSRPDRENDYRAERHRTRERRTRTTTAQRNRRRCDDRLSICHRWSVSVPICVHPWLFGSVVRRVGTIQTVQNIFSA